MKKIFVFFSLLALWHGLCFPVMAETFGEQKQTSLGVNPSVIEVVLDKDTPIRKQITLINLTNNALPIKAVREPFIPSEEVTTSADSTKAYDASSWLTLDSEDQDFILQPKAFKLIDVTITQPIDASPGGHYATVVFEPLVPTDIISKGSVFIYTRIAVLLFMQVRGEVKESLELVSVTAPMIVEGFPTMIKIKLRNKGNIHLRPKGDFVTKNNLLKNTLESSEFVDSIILPNTEKEFVVNVNPSIWIGQVELAGVIKYGSQDKKINVSPNYVIVFPYKIIALVIFVPSILTVSLLLLRKRLRKALLILFFNERPKETKSSPFAKIKFPLKA